MVGIPTQIEYPNTTITCSCMYLYIITLFKIWNNIINNVWDIEWTYFFKNVRWREFEAEAIAGISEFILLASETVEYYPFLIVKKNRSLALIMPVKV